MRMIHSLFLLHQFFHTCCLLPQDEFQMFEINEPYAPQLIASLDAAFREIKVCSRRIYVYMYTIQCVYEVLRGPAVADY